MNIVSEHIDKVRELCKKYHVSSLYLFGSATSNQFNDQSDIDFLVEFDPIDLSGYFSNYLSLQMDLKQLFNREVDLIEKRSIKNPILLASIERNKELIYG